MCTTSQRGRATPILAPGSSPILGYLQLDAVYCPLSVIPATASGATVATGSNSRPSPDHWITDRDPSRTCCRRADERWRKTLSRSNRCNSASAATLTSDRRASVRLDIHSRACGREIGSGTQFALDSRQAIGDEMLPLNSRSSLCPAFCDTGQATWLCHHRLSNRVAAMTADAAHIVDGDPR